MLLAAYQKKNQAKQQKAAIDANAPLEDEDAALGPVDSDEEMTAVMHGLTNWNPQPVVTPLIQAPIDREYQKKRLYEQLHNATNGFTINICKVVGYGAQKLPPGHPGLDPDGDTDAGQATGIEIVADRRASAMNMQMPPRRTSSNSQR
jgi:SAGA-associated factor 73